MILGRTTDGIKKVGESNTTHWHIKSADAGRLSRISQLDPL